MLAAATLVGGACGGDDEPTVGGAAQGHNDADVAFVQGMIPHHRQAVDMADLVIEKGERAEVKDLARRIRDAQGPEIQTMEGWMRDWGVSAQGEHGTEQHGGTEGGMADAEMREVMPASGTQLDRMFLEAMIRHHEGAVDMAQAEVGNGRFGPAKELARRIIATQNAEIAEMRRLLGR